MAKFYEVNVSCSLGGISAMYSLKRTLVSTTKWRVSASSDGTTFFANSDGLTHSGTGAGGFANNRSWYHLIDANEKFSLIVQHGNTPSDNTGRFYVKVCPSGNYRTGGTIGTATQVPIHENEEVMYNTGKPNNPEFKWTLFGPAGTNGENMYSHTIALDTEENGIFPFWFMGVSRSTATTNTLIALEPLAADSYNPNDQYPYLFIIKHKADGGGITYTDYRSNATVHVPSDTESTVYTPIFGMVDNLVSNSFRPMTDRGNDSWTTFGNPVFTSSYDGTELLVPFQIGRQATTPAFRRAALSGVTDQSKQVGLWKGTCKYIKLITNPARLFPDTYNLATDAYIVFGANNASCVTIPWPENVTPLIS